MDVEDGTVFFLHVVEDPFLLVRMPGIGDFELFLVLEDGIGGCIGY